QVTPQSPSYFLLVHTCSPIIVQRPGTFFLRSLSNRQDRFVYATIQPLIDLMLPRVPRLGKSFCDLNLLQVAGGKWYELEGRLLQLRLGGFRPPTGKDIRAGHTPFHARDVPPERLAQWPDK